MKRALVGLLLLTSLPAAAPVFPQAQPLSDEELGGTRGGFTLPNGLEVALAVITETRIDGQLAVRSSYRIDDGAPVVLVQGRDPATGLLVTVDPDSPDGTATADGVIRLQGSPGGSRIVLNGDRIDVTHLSGRAIGSVIANSANNRAIDVLTTVQIDIGNATPELIGSAMLRVDDIAANAGSLVRR
jgi:hypothetical protein